MATTITQLEPLNLNTTANYVVGTLSATGNVTGNYFIGNGSQLTGGYGNSNVEAYLASGTNTSNIATTGNVVSTSVRAQAMTMGILLGG